MDRYILLYMKSMLIELDDETAERIERVAPGRNRQRSEFVRAAIRRALWDLEERETAEAYGRQPDIGEPYFEPAVWTPLAKPRRRRAKR